MVFSSRGKLVYRSWSPGLHQQQNSAQAGGSAQAKGTTLPDVEHAQGTAVHTHAYMNTPLTSDSQLQEGYFGEEPG